MSHNSVVLIEINAKEFEFWNKTEKETGIKVVSSASNILDTAINSKILIWDAMEWCVDTYTHVCWIEGRLLELNNDDYAYTKIGQNYNIVNKGNTESANFEAGLSVSIKTFNIVTIQE